ncbi:MAG: hypothetical protein A2V85_10875 [Chloroflexi bacterium RBG_16_72_14]|nr:MAG: hypothetical protein A2V85_10875 [Chloroflexi bacterium RBG_16_72_14]
MSATALRLRHHVALGLALAIAAGGAMAVATTRADARTVRATLPGAVAAAAGAAVAGGLDAEVAGGLDATVAGGPAPAGVSASAIVPGSVNRTSLDVSATYDVDVRLGVAARTVRGTVTIGAGNRSGSGIDRLELNTVMARLGALRLGTVTVDGVAVKPSVDDQTIIVPLGGVLPSGADAVVVVPFSATLRSSLSGSNWLFTRANGIIDMHRWIPWVSRRRAFDRPNHGDPFVTPVSPLVTVRIRSDAPLRYGNTGDRVAISADGLTRIFRAVNVRDFVVTAASDYRTRQVVVGDNIVRVVYRPGFPATAALDAAANALRKLEARLGPYPYKVLKVVQSAGAYGMEGPGVAWIPTGTGSSNLRYLVTHEIAHQWFYGLVGNDQAREPFADEAAADFVARSVLGSRRGSRCATAALDRSIYRYSSSCYYEIVYIQGGNLLDNARRRMGGAAFWAALRGYVADHRWELVHTRTLLDALDDATLLHLATSWDARFPTLY